MGRNVRTWQCPDGKPFSVAGASHDGSLSCTGGGFELAGSPVPVADLTCSGCSPSLLGQAHCPTCEVRTIGVLDFEVREGSSEEEGRERGAKVVRR